MIHGRFLLGFDWFLLCSAQLWSFLVLQNAIQFYCYMKARTAQLPIRHLKINIPYSQKKRRKVLTAWNLLNKDKKLQKIQLRNFNLKLCNINFLCNEKFIISMKYDATRKLQHGKFYVTFSSPSSHIEKISKMLMEKAMVVKGLIKFY